MRPVELRLVLVGPPGAGKGTQAEVIAAELSIPKISTGDIFRANVGQSTPLGLEAKRYMDEGKLVPDDVTIRMVRDRLSEPDAAAGFLLDGFPRTVPQAVELDEMLDEMKTQLDVVLELVVDNDEVIRRLSGRRTCRGCNKIWHIEFDPTTQDGVCDRCGGALYQRDDDRPETVLKRLDEYAEKTAPLIGFYANQGKLIGIDATGLVEDITKRALAELQRYCGPGE